MKKILLLAGFLISTLLQAQVVTNPILAGYYPDPSICRVGNDYYIVNSSFSYYPGLPLFHSKDLVNWEQIGYAMDRPEQLDLDKSRISGGLYAPAITYHDGLFYIVCTEVSKLGNFVITAKDPKGPWSNPVKIPEVNGIDPSLFFDADGKSYIVYNSIPPNNISMHDGHRTIRMYEFDKETLKVKGEEILLINGGTDMAKKPVWIEGPHLLKKDGWYYLICAEGGTGYNHSEVVFRSQSPQGPFVSYEKNPILTQRHLDPKRNDPITTTGHADFVETPDGDWWGIFLGCRPYDFDHYNTGRETFIAPVKWQDGWPSFDLGGETVKYEYPIKAKVNPKGEKFNGNYTFHDNFEKSILNIRYQFLRTPRSTWYSLSEKPGQLTINLRPETVLARDQPSFIGFHQPHLKGHAALELFFDAKTSKEQAGLLLFQNERANYFISLSRSDMGIEEIRVTKANEPVKTVGIKKDAGQPVYFKIEARHDHYVFYYALKKDKWEVLIDKVDARELSTKTAGGFTGVLYAMYATSNGEESQNKASFGWFEIKNDDDIYKKEK